MELIIILNYFYGLLKINSTIRYEIYYNIPFEETVICYQTNKDYYIENNIIFFWQFKGSNTKRSRVELSPCMPMGMKTCVNR
jgi:hypothetical protein